VELREWWAERQKTADTIESCSFPRATWIAGAVRRIGSMRSFFERNVFVANGTLANEIMADELTLEQADQIQRELNRLELTFITGIRVNQYSADHAKAEVIITTKRFPGPHMEGAYL
jgi:hypothetical protein